jgi:hypothetical protein
LYMYIEMSQTPLYNYYVLIKGSISPDHHNTVSK